MTDDNHEFSPPNPKGRNPHDYFGRYTIGDPIIAADLLRHYAEK